LLEVAAAFEALKSQLPLCIEFMFKSEAINRAQEQGILTLSPRRSKLSLNELPLEVNVDDILRGKIDDDYLYFGKKVTDQSKMHFAEWIIQQPDAEFEVFESLMDHIHTAIQ